MLHGGIEGRVAAGGRSRGAIPHRRQHNRAGPGQGSQRHPMLGDAVHGVTGTRTRVRVPPIPLRGGWAAAASIGPSAPRCSWPQRVPRRPRRIPRRHAFRPQRRSPAIRVMPMDPVSHTASSASSATEPQYPRCSSSRPRRPRRVPPPRSAPSPFCSGASRLIMHVYVAVAGPAGAPSFS